MTLSSEILDEFNAWLVEASAQGQIAEPTAMNLATVSADGKPSNRMVLLKEASLEGFTFFTNYNSTKGREIAANPCVSLCFYWMPLGKQVRIEGRAQKTHAKTSDAYFETRSLMSKVGAHASSQSEPLESHEALIAKAQLIEWQFKGKPIPRPAHWGGFMVVPERVEFWIDGPSRLHKRYEYRIEGAQWVKRWLNP